MVKLYVHMCSIALVMFCLGCGALRCWWRCQEQFALHLGRRGRSD